MKEQIVSIEVAKLSKEKGLSGVWCSSMYCIGYNSLPEDEELLECDWRNNVNGQFHLALAPTQSLLQKWLREKHNIHIMISHHKSNRYSCHISDECDNCIDTKLFGEMWETYEEALEAGLLTALKLI